ncbi:WD repeat-containing protein 44-like [Panicum miliaceum]|uniref:WD repeat-containing protein 44-like n=1 Tax=Panicum miliaceum TaxID=4540 RepID=A0A3L6S2E8_PANMI|nr:WD repeat-containing protein 44-like [Panicum miliaceum]
MLMMCNANQVRTIRPGATIYQVALVASDKGSSHIFDISEKKPKHRSQIDSRIRKRSQPRRK